MPLVLGIPCPGCGITRAFGLALHGHLAEAFAFHPLWPLILAYFVFIWIYKLVDETRGTPPRLDTYRVSAVACVAVVSFWFLRLGFFFAQGGLQVVAHDNLVARLARVLSP
jgi:hypothetical protein